MPRLALVGAGSVVFTKRLLTDILSSAILRTSHIALHDIDAERLAASERMAHWIADAVGAEPSITAHLDRRMALARADIVINTVQVGGAPASRLDFEIPGRFGLRYTIADTIGVGGVFRALRTIPFLVELVRDVEDVCPGALLINYTNPLATLVRAISQMSSVNVVGLCHSVFWTVDALARYLGVPRNEIDTISGGVNHLAFVLKLQHRGQDLYPMLRRIADEGPLPTNDLVRMELLRRLGFFPTESSEHHGEYSPWFIGKHDDDGDAIERFNIPIGEYLRRVDNNLAEYAETRRKLEAREPLEISQGSGEYAAAIAVAIERGAVTSIIGNVPNRGGLISNLDADACVEVPCLVDGLGIHPVAIGPLPRQLVAYLRGALDMQALTVQAALHHDRDAVDWAVMTDPVVQSHLTLQDCWRLTAAMIEAEAEWLPKWMGGGRRD